MPTRRAILLLLFSAPLWAVAFWTPVFYVIALLYAALIILAGVLDWWAAGSITRFEAQRQHDQRLSLGVDNRITVLLRNLAPRPTDFWLRDEPPVVWANGQETFSGRLAPYQTWRGHYYVHPLRRGDYRFERVNVRWGGPLGLMLRQGSLEAATAVKVYPNLLDVRRYDLLLRRNRLQEIGLRHTRQFGQGAEYERLREYQADDDFRRIHWKATARRNRPITIQYQTERSQTIIAMIDIGRLLQSPIADMAKLDYVINAVLLLAYVAGGMGDKVGLLTFAQDVHQYLAPRQGRGQFYRMLELLYAVEAQPIEPDYGRSLTYLALKQRKRALILIFTDLSGGYSAHSLAAHVGLLAQRHLPFVITISDPDLTDAARQQPHDSLGVYQQVVAARLLDERRALLDRLQHLGVLTLDAPANQLSIAVINRYLQLKGQMRL